MPILEAQDPKKLVRALGELDEDFAANLSSGLGDDYQKMLAKVNIVADFKIARELVEKITENPNLFYEAIVRAAVTQQVTKLANEPLLSAGEKSQDRAERPEIQRINVDSQVARTPNSDVEKLFQNEQFVIALASTILDHLQRTKASLGRVSQPKSDFLAPTSSWHTARD